MVKKSIIKALSNDELLKYVKPESRFVYDAIEIAYETLKERGVIFSSLAEEQRIIQMIKDKKDKNSHITAVNKWDINAVDDNSLNFFYSQKAIWFFSIFGGIHIGSVLLAINLFVISKNKIAWLAILFGLFYSTIIYCMYCVTQIYLLDYSILTYIILVGIGSSVLQFYFWDKYLNNILYKKRKILTPFFLSVIFNFLLLVGILLFQNRLF